MSWIGALLLLPAAPFAATVPQPNAELDAAHACLVAGTSAWLEEYDWRPEKDERWRWALKVVGECENEINAAADTKGARYWSSDVGGMGITARQMLRSEALYYVDRLIRENFQSKTEQSQ